MKIDIGESLVSSYLRHVKHCYIVQPNWKPSGKWTPEPNHYDQVHKEFNRIQGHQAFIEIFKTNFKTTLLQTEIDMLGIDQQGTLYAANVAFNENGVSYGPKTDTRNRVVKNLLRAHLALSYYFPGQNQVLMFCSPKVSPATELIINDFFNILHSEFDSPQVRFLYYSNDIFRDSILLETIDNTVNEFDTSELFLRSFKLLSLFGQDTGEELEDLNAETPVMQEKVQATEVAIEKPGVQSELPAIELRDAGIQPAAETETRQEETSLQSEEPDIISKENPEDENKILKEIEKVRNRVPRWLKRPTQNNSKILIAFLKLMETSEEVSLAQLAEVCGDVTNFSGNYAQMINIADKNHGKVFSNANDKIILWEPVSDFIIQEYINSKKAYYE